LQNGRNRSTRATLPFDKKSVVKKPGNRNTRLHYIFIACCIFLSEADQAQ